MNKYQNSECKGKYLHNFQIISQNPKGSFERCERCGMKQFFSTATPNHIYISYHIRQALQPTDSRFEREYPHSTHIIKR